MHSPKKLQDDVRDSNDNYKSIYKIEQNQSIMNLIPRKFREMKSIESQQSTLSIQVSYKNRVTMRTTYGDLSFSHLGHTEYLCNRLLFPRRNQKPEKTTISKNCSSKDGTDDQSNALHFENEKKSSLSNPHSSPFVFGGDVLNSRRNDPEDHHFVHEDPAQVSENLVINFPNSTEVHGAFEKHLTEDAVSEDELAKYSSSDLERFTPNNIHFSPNSFVSDTNDQSDVRSSEGKTSENDFENIYSFPPSKNAYFFRGHNFSDEFLSPFEFNVESRRNYIGDEFTDATSNNHLRKILSPLPAALAVKDFIHTKKLSDEPFEFEDCTQPVEDDLPYKYFDRVSDADGLSDSIRSESSVSRNFDRRRDSIFAPVEDHDQADSNSVHIRFSPTTTNACSQESISREQPDATPETSSPSVIEATPFYKNSDYPWEKYHRKSETVSCLYPRSEVDMMIKNGEEVHFRASKECEHDVDEEEDVNGDIEDSPPIGLKKTPELLAPFVSYIHDGKLVMEDFSD